ncbi:hypothetical protein V6U78_09210 [Marinospirillum sp. MEB164]|uniref:Tetratricopeptide repeat-containing protein n=1 Tax=Marinospirillum alkalitolerans TaxID=3123374 RepID=A0ABW8PY37_9GAMM
MISRSLIWALLVLSSVLVGCAQQTPSQPLPASVQQAHRWSQLAEEAQDEGRLSLAVSYWQRAQEAYQQSDHWRGQLQARAARIELALRLGADTEAASLLAAQERHLAWLQASPEALEQELQVFRLQKDYLAALNARQQGDLPTARQYTARLLAQSLPPSLFLAVGVLSIELAQADQDPDWAEALVELQHWLAQAEISPRLRDHYAYRLQRFEAAQQMSQAPEAAQAQLYAVAEFYRTQGAWSALAATLTDLGDHYQQQGHLDQAVFYWQRAYTLRLAQGEQWAMRALEQRLDLSSVARY